MVIDGRYEVTHDRRERKKEGGGGREREEGERERMRMNKRTNKHPWKQPKYP